MFITSEAFLDLLHFFIFSVSCHCLTSRITGVSTFLRVLVFRIHFGNLLRYEDTNLHTSDNQ